MKKIVGILAVAAVATSLFAADVSAGVGLASTLFKTTSADKAVVDDNGIKKDGTMEAFTALKDNQTADYKTLFSLQFSSDNAGGGVKYWDNGSDAITVGKYNVWFKPMDNLKLSFNENSLGLFACKYTGWNAHNVGVGAGYGIEYTADAVTVNFNICPTFITKVNVADEEKPGETKSVTKIGELGAKVTYAADFGTIAVLFDANNGKDKDGKAKDFAALKVGAGFSGSFSGVNVIANVGYSKNAGETKHGVGCDAILVTLSAGGNVDALGWAVCVPAKVLMATYPTEDAKEPTEFEVGAEASVSYNVNGIGLKAYFETADLLAHNTTEWEVKDKKLSEKKKETYFKGTIGLDVTGSVGAASWKVAPKCELDTTKDKSSTVFSVGFETGINF